MTGRTRGIWWWSVVLGSVVAGGLCAGCRSTQPTLPSQRGQRADVVSARAATRQQDWATAASRWNDVFRTSGGSPEACLETARAFLMLHQEECAKQVLDIGLEQFPTDPALLEMQGRVLSRMGFRRAAESCFEKSLSIDAKRPVALEELAKVRLELGLHAAATEVLQQRIRLGNCEPDVWLLAARASWQCGKLCDAFRAYEQAFQRPPCSTAELVSAASLYADERVRRKDEQAQRLALDWLTRAVQADPQCTLAHYYLGMIHEDRGDLECAAACYQRAAETDPACLSALTALAQLHHRRGNFEASRAFALRALELEKDSTRRAALERMAQEPLANNRPTADSR
jgi:tetratricopeptide (TPR) repeat protein